MVTYHRFTSICILTILLIATCPNIFVVHAANYSVTVSVDSNADLAGCRVVIDGSNYRNGNIISLTSGSHSCAIITPTGWNWLNWITTTNCQVTNPNSQLTTLTISGNGTFGANWGPIVTFKISPGTGGTITTSLLGQPSTSVTYTNGQNGTMQLQTAYSIQANAASGYSFSGWTSTVGTVSSANSAFTTLTPNVTGTITATFQLTSTVRLLNVNSLHGNPNPQAGSYAYTTGTTVTCSVQSPVSEAGVNYTCVSWTGTGSIPSNGWGTSVNFAITQNSSITWNWVASVGDLLILPAAGYSYNNIVQEGLGLSHGHLNTVSQQTVNATTGQSISISLNYQIYSPSNPGEIDQLFFVESWTPTWPPTGYTIPVYNGGPGISPGVTNSGSISFTTPSKPGTYYLWLCVDSQYTMQDAINHKTTSMNGTPAHIKIIVSSPAIRTLTVISARGNPNPTVGNHSYAPGASITCSVLSPVTQSGVTYTCTGWSGTGSVPSSGSGTSTSFSITQDSTITWNWQSPTPTPPPTDITTPTPSPIISPIITKTPPLTPTPYISPTPTETITPTESPTPSPPTIYPPFDILQTKTGNMVFSWSKSMQNSQTFSISAVSATISVSADLSLEMPVGVTATSNATNVKGLNSALITTSITSQTSTITLTLNVEATVGGTSRSITRTLTKSFSSPLGTSSEIVFDTVAVPAIDFGLGQVTIDLTPKFSLTGFAAGNFVTNGPCTLDASSIQCSESGTQTTMLAKISEEKNIQVSLTAPTMTISQINVGTNIGASIRPIIGDIYSADLGSLSLPVPTEFQLNGAPSATLLAEYLIPIITPTPAPQQNTAFPMNLLYIALTIVVIVVVATVLAVAIKRKEMSIGRGTRRKKKQLTI